MPGIRIWQRRLSQRECEVLAASYTDGNRSARRDWLRRFADLALTSGDALEQDDRPRAIEILCEAVCLEHAVALSGDGDVKTARQMRTGSWEVFFWSSGDEVTTNWIEFHQVNYSDGYIHASVAWHPGPMPASYAEYREQARYRGRLQDRQKNSKRRGIWHR